MNCNAHGRGSPTSPPDVNLTYPSPHFSIFLQVLVYTNTIKCKDTQLTLEQHGGHRGSLSASSKIPTYLGASPPLWRFPHPQMSRWGQSRSVGALKKILCRGLEPLLFFGVNCSLISPPFILPKKSGFPFLFNFLWLYSQRDGPCQS